MTPRYPPEPPDGLPDPIRTWWTDHQTGMQDAFHPDRNGHIPDWENALARIPVPASPNRPQLAQAAVSDGTRDELDPKPWHVFHPWRKGPWQLGNLFVDTEWKSDMKWDRLTGQIQSLEGRTCLDVGCGNGYHLWRMRGEGAKAAIGVDPFLLYVYQFRAVQRRIPDPAVVVLPLDASEIAPGLGFDTVFSMGVLYHTPDPLEHLRTLLNAARPQGELVLETLTVPEESGPVLQIKGRYARMRNIRSLPAVNTLLDWVSQAGWKHPRHVDTTQTTSAEQRQTEWMKFYSLDQFLDPQNPDKTVEGYPAPRRSLILAEAPLNS